LYTTIINVTFIVLECTHLTNTPWPPWYYIWYYIHCSAKGLARAIWSCWNNLNNSISL